MRTLALPLLAACALAWGIAAAIGAVASTGGTGPGARGRLPVVATTTQVADLARAVGGARVQVTGLLAPGAEPHTHEVSPGDVTALSRARVVVRSGGEVDGWLDDAVEAARGHGPVLDLGAHVARRGDDPHWWQDPRNALRAVAALRQGFTSADPAGAAAYRRAAAGTSARIRATDRAIAACWSGVPARDRRLVTTHDAYGYYAARYGLQVVGSVLPALTVRAQPSARDLARLADAIRRARVRAVFGERALNQRVARAVAGEAGARVGGELVGDALRPGQTYLEALRADTRTLVAGLAPGRRCAL